MKILNSRPKTSYSVSDDVIADYDEFDNNGNETNVLDTLAQLQVTGGLARIDVVGANGTVTPQPISVGTMNDPAAAEAYESMVVTLDPVLPLVTVDGVSFGEFFVTTAVTSDRVTIDQLFFNRPFPGYGQYRMPLKNLYMCGSSTHPGGGVSSACGANAAREILLDLRRPNTVPEDDFWDE